MSNVEVNSGASGINISGVGGSTAAVAIQQPSVNISIAKEGITSIPDAHFVFSQEVVSKVWEIEHNMNKYPSVTIVDAGGNILYTEVEYIDKNNLEVRFVASTRGKAYLN